jgi:hypothetical protein
MVAINHAMTIIDWQENLTKEEMPPEWMWHLDEEVATFLERVFRERRERMGLPPDDEGGSDGKRMVGNELTRGRGRDS